MSFAEACRHTNPRYVIWRALNPDAKLFEFMVFISTHWAEFFAEKSMKKPGSVHEYQSEFDSWLIAKYPEACK